MAQTSWQYTESVADATEDYIKLRCPECASAIGAIAIGSATKPRSFDCPRCHYSMRCENGIWQALATTRLEYFSHFINDYQHIRTAEGRGSLKPDFYLHLPYRDVTGKNTWQWKIRARTYDCLTKKLLPALRRDADNALKVLDLGAGNGWMSFRLALHGCRPVAVDILTNEQDGLGAATHFEKRLGILFPRVRAEMSRLPFADGQFDAAIFNASFHYAENHRAVLHEAVRCVKVGGRVIIADSPWYSSAEAGEQMLAQRRADFLQLYGTASASIHSLEYLTDQRLRDMECALGIHWERVTPNYGLQWTMRPVFAKLRGKREPSSFRIYSARKAA
jgi:ubiquinone/menaquinone biosynthesis C-methylase UbiE